MHNVHYHHDNHANICNAPTFTLNMYNVPYLHINMDNVPYLHVKHGECPLPSRQAWRMSLTFALNIVQCRLPSHQSCTMSHPHVPDHHHHFCMQPVVSSCHPLSPAQCASPYLQHTRHTPIHPPSRAPIVSVTMGCWDRYLADMNQHWATRDLGHWHWYLANMDQRWTAGTSVWPT